MLASISSKDGTGQSRTKGLSWSQKKTERQWASKKDRKKKRRRRQAARKQSEREKEWGEKIAEAQAKRARAKETLKKSGREIIKRKQKKEVRGLAREKNRRIQRRMSERALAHVKMSAVFHQPPTVAESRKGQISVRKHDCCSSLLSRAWKIYVDFKTQGQRVRLSVKKTGQI